MENNEEQNIVDKAQEAAQMAKEVSQLAANLASGNYIAAIKNAINLLKNKQFKKQLRRKIIMAILKAMIPIIVALCFFGLLNAMKDKMIDLFANAGTAIRGFIAETWQWMTDDYWIKLEEEVEYTVDADTGEILGTTYTIKDEDLLDENGNPRNTTTEKYTIVDQYIKELGKQGISLKDLRLLGDADYSDEEKLLENEANKTLVEKYISEFIRADIITQQPHKRRGTALVQGNNQNHVDGGNKFSSGAYEETVELTDDDYKEMEFLLEEEFMAELGLTGNDISSYVNNTISIKEGKSNDLRYKFTISKKTGELILLETSTTIHKEQSAGIPIGEWFKGVDSWYNDSQNTVTVKIKSIDYKEYISKYSMPYEFLINLCEVTQNPEFVYHVALLARDTRIDLVIHDNTTVDRVTTEIESDYETYWNTSESLEGASLQSEQTKKVRKGTLTITQTPVLKVRYANTWSFHEEYICTKTVKGSLKEGPVITTTYPVTGKLNGPKEGVAPGTGEYFYYYDKEFLVEKRENTQILTMTTTYNEPILKAENSGEKSKQFLGLLRNDTGICLHDECDNEEQLNKLLKQNPVALKCAQEAEFNRKGINVQYRIPNMTRTEAPLNRLTSGLEMLYSVLQSNSSGYDESDKLLEDIEDSYDEQDKYIADKDFESAYVVKMQGLVEHLRYLMTFPENENFDIKDDPTDDDDDNDDDEVLDPGDLNIEDIIVKTDEPGAAPEVTKDQLKTIINKAYTGKKQQNALSLVDQLMNGQNSKKVNPIFMLAVIQQETSVGTANTDYVKIDKNWTSYNLGHKYSSPQENMNTTINGIANGSYYFKAGKYTIREIGYTYCPNTVAYPTPGDNWVVKVTGIVKYLYSLIGEDVGGSVIEDENPSATTFTSSKGITYTIYKQQDYPETPFFNETIAKCGCSITSDATVLSGFGSTKNPSQLLNGRITIGVDDVLTENGLTVNRTSVDKDSIISNLNGGKPVIIHVDSSSSYTNDQHWMPLLDIKTSNGKTMIYVGNPNIYGKTGWDEIDHLLVGCDEMILIK